MGGKTTNSLLCSCCSTTKLQITDDNLQTAVKRFQITFSTIKAKTMKYTTEKLHCRLKILIAILPNAVKVNIF
jgi:hypothetical protein